MAIKHADAGAISISLARTSGKIQLAVSDDGIGMHSQPAGARDDRLGQRIMNYRCDLLGGTLTVRAAPTGGTTVQCEVPVPGVMND